ncbi:MAG: NAD(P)/FAD-dependent oxidoreductase [Phycisphaerales bacterium]
MGDVPRVVILGGGFGGLYAARALRNSPVRLTVIDRRNYHLFQPLLYQVATASLSPAEIAQPIRHILKGQRNAEVVLGEAVSVDVGGKQVRVRGVMGEESKEWEEAYDYLVVATGATHSYFGKDEWATLAPGLKDVNDATEMRRRFLLAFEGAEREHDAARRRARLTFVVVGAGPTGVELAGAMMEIAKRAMPRDFRNIDTTTARVVLCEGEARVLPTFAPEMSARAARDLAALGVEVRTETRVTDIDAGGVWIGEGGRRERIEAGNVFWAAGVRASSVGGMLGAERDSAGRVKVLPDLSIPAHPEVFVIGDLAHAAAGEGRGLTPGVAQGAMQMGVHVARIIDRETRGAGVTRPAFRYRDKGMMATIGRAKAVAEIGGRKFGGYPAWLLWLFIHLMFLIGFRNRLLVFVQWMWAYVTFQRGARLITGK